MRKTARTVLLAGSLLVLAFGSGARAQELGSNPPGYVMGDSTAPVTIVEFGDFACTACEEFWRITWPDVRRELIETGRVVWRHVPFVLGFPNGEEAAYAAECAADQGAFWEIYDRLFGGQSEWMGDRRPRAVFRRYAAEIGLDQTAFDHCVEEELGKDRTEAANRAARDAGVRATPTFFVNGRPVLGALPYEAFRVVVEEAEGAGD